MYGAEGLLDRMPGARGPHPNRVASEVEEAILAHALAHPTHGAQRVADELMLRGVQVSSGSVRGVWIRGRAEEASRAAPAARKDGPGERLRTDQGTDPGAERFDPEYRERHIEVKATGELVAVDTFFAGTLKGVGKVYIQTVLDCFSRYVWARLYTSTMPVTAVQILNNHVLPFFEEHGVKVQTVLSDNGREYCGREDRHPYELFLQLEEIEHRKTKVGRPQSNAYIERFHRTPGRAPEGEGAHDLVRVRRRDAGGSGRLHRDLQPEPSAPRPRHGGAAAVSGLQEGDPEAQEPEEVNQKGGEDRSLKR